MAKTISIQGKNIILFYCSSLKTLGLESRVSLPNKTGKITDAFVQVFTTSGKFVDELQLDPVADKSITPVELNDLYSGLQLDSSQNYVFLFSLVPEGYSPNKLSDIELGEISRLNSTQDFYIEHYIENSISAGVLYKASPVMNNKSIIPQFYFFMQAPKIYLSKHQDTIFQFFNPNISIELENSTLYYFIRETDGTILSKGELQVSSNGMSLLSIKDTLKKNNISSLQGFLHFEAFSDEAIFITLTMQYNKTLETLDLEHTLSPHYYLQKNKMDKKVTHQFYSDLYKTYNNNSVSTPVHS